MRRRVVITGMGVVTPLGDTLEGLYRSQIEGRSGVSRIRHFDATTFPTKIAAQVPDFDLSRYVKDSNRWASAGPNSRFAAAAAQRCLHDAGVLDHPKIDRTRFGIYMGVGEGIQDFHRMISIVARTYSEERRTVDARAFSVFGGRELDSSKEREQEPHNTTAHLASYFDLLGPNYSCLTACAAGSQAVGEATELIRWGDADIMLSGGAHSMIHPFGVTGFNLLTALSTANEEPTKASCPFDARRNGFVLGEGSAMLVVEELEHARRRGARIYAELTGYGSTADAFRITDSHPDGRGAIQCMEGALKDAGLPPSEIGYINAHGTSTQVNDRCETLAIKKVFGDGAYHVPISSTKSMLGHLIAAAGSVELIISVLAMLKGVLPPTINYEVKDPDCDLDYIPNVAREKRVRHVLSNSFGFGGQNVSLIASRFDG
jgi:3-oxoacyl-[acyl-carrier-protein] synthase II